MKYEVTGISNPSDYFQIKDLKDDCTDAAVIDFEEQPGSSAEKRIFEITRSNYLNDDASAILDFGTIESKALLHKQYKAAFKKHY